MTDLFLKNQKALCMDNSMQISTMANIWVKN